MLFNTITLAAAFLGISSAATFNKRSTESVNLYAYGKNISGLNVFYGDGLAWIGYASANWLNEVSNVTFNEDPTSTQIPWTVDSDRDLWTSGAYSLYIVPTTGAFEQVGFVSNSTNSSAPTGASTKGFTWYGTSLAYAASDSDYEMMFWAVSTNTTGIWKLVWNAQATTIPSASTPVTLKSTAPPNITAEVSNRRV